MTGLVTLTESVPLANHPPDEVLEDVDLDEKVIIRQGALALGTITEAIPKRRMGRTGKLEVRIDSVTLANGARAPLRAVSAGVDGSRAAAVTTATAAAGMIFFPAAPLFLLIKGKDITIPKGTFVTAYINNDLPLDPDKFLSQSTRNTALVSFKCDTPDAEIWIEEKFVGNAPASIRLPAGEYQVVVRKPGYQTWKRTLTVTAGSLMNLSIDLEKQP
ncbi:MAG: PEGA domain-containing protein [Blastocatellia bacterium]